MFMMTISKEITEEIVQIISDFNYLLIDLSIRGNEKNPILEIFVDNESGVSADDCAEISKAIGSFLDGGDYISPGYRLDVSSPGVERPLKFLQQYPKHLNRQFEVTFTSGDGTKKLNAKLIGIADEKLTFDSGKNQIIVSFGDIISAKVLISF